MNVGIDIRTLLERQYSGVSEYTWQVVQALLRHAPSDTFYLFYNNAKPQYRAPVFNFPNARIEGFRYPNKLFNASLAFLKYPKLDDLMQQKLDWFFLPSMQFFAKRRETKLLLTVHDLSFMYFPEFFGLKDRLWQRAVDVEELCRHATHINAISENTKQDIVKLFNVPEAKITVTPLGVGEEYRPVSDPAALAAVSKKYKLPRRFILFLGNLEPRKNVEGIIAAFSQAKNLPADIDLVIAGKRCWLSEGIYKVAKSSPKKDQIHFIGYVDTADKPELYSLAEAFMYPSFYEGFGLPPLEAMACGVPVVASNASSLPEVIGDAGLLVDPYNVNQMAAALEQVLTDKDLRLGLKEKGLAKAKQFDWDRTAKDILQVLKKGGPEFDLT